MYKINFKRLKSWFLNERRDLPWRDQPNPYAVWVSEVMLQQTQVAVVIPYFERWMSRFPTIATLADAKLDEVIKLWEGLGYYSRARSLHEGAQFVVKHYGGQLPSDENALRKIKGLGPYTVGAILSFAFHKKAAAVDGNVIRVLSRYYQIEEDIAKTKTINHMREIAFQILPEDESWIQNEALIELGATICKKKPACGLCPLRSDCQAYASGSADRLPFKSTKVETEYLYRSVPVINCGTHFLVKRGQKGQIMSDLHEFPFFETNQKGWTVQKLMKELSQQWSLEVEFLQELPAINHSFTKYQVRLNPVLFRCLKSIEIVGHQWHSLDDLRQLAFSSGHRRIFSSL
jgi:A/G-specific adenine glycosylase